MRWFKRWLRFVTIVALIFPLLLFILLSIGSNNFHGNEFNAKASHHYSTSLSSLIASHNELQPFKPTTYLRRNSTGREINEWRTSVDFNQLLDIRDFDFIRNGTHLCDSRRNDDKFPFLTILVHSSPKNFIKRNVIRKTWGSVKQINGHKIVLAFIIGWANNSIIEQQLDAEYNLNRDLVIASFVDDYQNLTYKHLTSYKWVLHFCNTTKFVMKADDDAFIDIYSAVKVLSETFYSSAARDSPRDIIACSLFPDGTLPKRDGKWSLSYDEYPFDTYPSYCSGVAYFLTLDVVFDIYEAAHYIKPVLKIDDVFLTGIVAASLNIRHFPLNLKYTYDDKRLREWLYSVNVRHSSYMIGDIGDVHDWQSLMTQLWRKTTNVWNRYDTIVK